MSQVEVRARNTLLGTPCNFTDQLGGGKGDICTCASSATLTCLQALNILCEAENNPDCGIVSLGISPRATPADKAALADLLEARNCAAGGEVEVSSPAPAPVATLPPLEGLVPETGMNMVGADEIKTVDGQLVVNGIPLSSCDQEAKDNGQLVFVCQDEEGNQFFVPIVGDHSNI